MQPLVSVIIPVYKVEDCLVRCLESLARQSLKEIEIIMIDDASPDRCGIICEAYAAQDSRFKVFHHPENSGLSASRNTGIAVASCEYIMFVDSDDYVHEEFCKEAYECSKQFEADLVMFRYQSVGKNGITRNEKPKLVVNSGHKTRFEAMDLVINGAIKSFAWNKLYHRSLFSSISYPVGYYYEDIGTTYRIVWQANHIYYLDKVLYFNCYRDNSITTLQTEKARRDMLEMQMRQYHDLIKWHYPKEKMELYYINLIISYCILFGVAKANMEFSSFPNIIHQCRSIPSELTFKRKMLFILLKYCRPMFEFVCFLWGTRI